MILPTTRCQSQSRGWQLTRSAHFLGKKQLDVLIFFGGKADMDMRDGLHLSGKGAAVFADELADDQQQSKVAWEA